MPFKSWFWNNVWFPLTHPRRWLCDHGVPCPDCIRQRWEDTETLWAIADIVELKAGNFTFAQQQIDSIRRLLDSTPCVNEYSSGGSAVADSCG